VKPTEEFYHLKEGELFQVEDLNNFKFACCGCGLTHKFEFIVGSPDRSGKPRLFFKAYEDAEETKAIREAEKIVVTKGV